MFALLCSVGVISKPQVITFSFHSPRPITSAVVKKRKKRKPSLVIGMADKHVHRNTHTLAEFLRSRRRVWRLWCRLRQKTADWHFVVVVHVWMCVWTARVTGHHCNVREMPSSTTTPPFPWTPSLSISQKHERESAPWRSDVPGAGRNVISGAHMSAKRPVALNSTPILYLPCRALLLQRHYKDSCYLLMTNLKIYRWKEGEKYKSFNEDKTLTGMSLFPALQYFFLSSSLWFSTLSNQTPFNGCPLRSNAPGWSLCEWRSGMLTSNTYRGLI